MGAATAGSWPLICAVAAMLTVRAEYLVPWKVEIQTLQFRDKNQEAKW